MKKIFVGGYGGTGSRVFQKILKLGGYWIGETNSELDWYAKHYCSWEQSDKWYFDHDDSGFRAMLAEETAGRDSWSFKVGHLMYSFDLQKQIYPDCQCVLTIRHPLDTVTNTFNMHHTHGGLPNNASIQDRLDFYSKAHENALRHTDFIFKLEDSIFDTQNCIRNILEFAEIPVPDSLDMYTNWIQQPTSIGRGKEYYNQFTDHPILDRLGY